MAIPTYNTRQTDTGGGGQSNPFSGYKPWNPFANQQAKKQTPTQNPFGETARRVVPTAPLQVPTFHRRQAPRPTALQSQQAWQAAAQMQATLQQQKRDNLARLQSPIGQASLFNIPGMNDNGFLRGISQGGYVPVGPVDYHRAQKTRYNEWLAAGGVNKPVTDWFDPYDPAGSPYMTSQYIPAPEYNYNYGGGGWGGWGGGGGYEPEDTAAFYQGNYTQRRNRWNETLLTWGLRQE